MHLEGVGLKNKNKNKNKKYIFLREGGISIFLFPMCSYEVLALLP
jgi:hypothetical protein